MNDIHVSRELYRAVERGQLPRSFLERIQSDHLLARCPHCRAEAEAYEAEPKTEASAWSRLLKAIALLIERLTAPAEREERRARGDLEELMALPPEARGGRIERARGRFESPALVRLLLEESRRYIPHQPAEALHFAELARTVANRNPRMEEYFGLLILATVAIANAYRVQLDGSKADADLSSPDRPPRGPGSPAPLRRRPAGRS